MDEAPDAVRADKWLWAARFFKTRALAADAVKGGRVQVNGARIKPAKELHPGDRVEMTLGQSRLTVIVRQAGARRGPASDAALLYEETAQSRETREREAAQRRLAAAQDTGVGGRPTKRDRRRFDAATGARRGRR